MRHIFLWTLVACGACTAPATGGLQSSGDGGPVDVSTPGPDALGPDARADVGVDSGRPDVDLGADLGDAGTPPVVDFLADQGNFEIEIVAVDIQEDLRPLAETIIGERIQMAFVRAPPDGTRAVLFGA
ncbi:MAG: hypothetical protein AAGD10_18980, partial [Myxococcota bacterium]